jgi:hypothetical protein
MVNFFILAPLQGSNFTNGFINIGLHPMLMYHALAGLKFYKWFYKHRAAPYANVSRPCRAQKTNLKF